MGGWELDCGRKCPPAIWPEVLCCPMKDYFALSNIRISGISLNLVQTIHHSLEPGHCCLGIEGRLLRHISYDGKNAGGKEQMSVRGSEIKQRENDQNAWSLLA